MTLREQTDLATEASVVSSASAASTQAERGAPTSSPAPLPDRSKEESTGGEASNSDAGEEKFPQPKLRLKIHDLDHPGTAKFLDAVKATTVLPTTLSNVWRLLYRSPSDRHTTVPPTRSVTLVLRDMDGVAYTTGSYLDNDHKEIHFSLRYINSISPAKRLPAEIAGVITHELVHCYQWDAKGTCPGGLIEGVADWVRLNCHLVPPHWKRDFNGDWDRGYQHTAYFLEYLEQRFGGGTIRRLNDKLRGHKYDADTFWQELFGDSVEKLYCDYLDLENAKSKDNDGDDGDDGKDGDRGDRGKDGDHGKDGDAC